jgi:hypothetical protein
MSRCGSSAVVVGDGLAACASGRARRWCVLRPAHGGRVKLKRSRIFRGGQRWCGCKESENDSPSDLVHTRWRSAAVRWGQARFSGEAMPLLKLGKACLSLGEAVHRLGRGWGSSGRTGHGGRARAGMAGGGELVGAGVFARVCGKVKSGLLCTWGTYRRPRAWLGAGVGDRRRPCATKRLGTWSNTWKCDSARVQTPIGRISSRIWARSPCRICSPEWVLSFVHGRCAVLGYGQGVVMSPKCQCHTA